MAMRLEYLTYCAKMPHKWGFNVPHHKQLSPDLHSSYGTQAEILLLQLRLTPVKTEHSKVFISINYSFYSTKQEIFTSYGMETERKCDILGSQGLSTLVVT